MAAKKTAAMAIMIEVTKHFTKGELPAYGLETNTKGRVWAMGLPVGQGGSPGNVVEYLNRWGDTERHTLVKLVGAEKGREIWSADKEGKASKFAKATLSDAPPAEGFSKATNGSAQ